MAWELQIWRAAASSVTETASVPLGDLEKITSEIELYFPEITWVTPMNGVWETNAGSVEFDIRGRPVHFVAVEHPPGSRMSRVVQNELHTSEFLSD